MVNGLNDTEYLGEFEKEMRKILFLGRIVGVYVSLAMQRTTSAIIRPVLISDFLNRVCLKSANTIESMMTLDEVGGELLNVGELIFKGINGEKERCDIEFIDEEELEKRINNVVSYN